ncbi:Helicase conserved C-terminal domain containing protein [Klebsormidium nitens]|uniref:ATP-dependent DNA helicase n=1 Tax=Klebsormidium nitens TaxID=105231 RepID=A0A1Y1I869_KLENI|nr:Helicase conserved C-terminal domain containing protein [Klebsormidium nitens]|eukprot:GAQ84897.1 Helicase conserved C-terminal domain containing protein [Klebsormidium nitens]
MKAALSFMRQRVPERPGDSSLPVEGGKQGQSGSLKVEQARSVLQRFFGHAHFRGQQERAVLAALNGRDCFVLMPTGGGKSVCYQCPALCGRGLALVVSPLIALMEDQVAALKRKNVPAEFLSSTQKTSLKAEIYDDLASGRPETKLLYVTPELIATKGFMAKLRKLHGRGLLSLIAIDESHCISAWGHDFRPSYGRLAALKEQLPGVPVMALTATANKTVQEDILRSLNLERPLIFQASFNRPNIRYEVRFKDVLPGQDPYRDLVRLLNAEPGQCAIVYCLSRSSCDGLAARLLSNGIPCKPYHAGLPDAERSRTLKDWVTGRIPVVAATIAFGMGIDRADVRLVVHFNMPKSIEGFYQESGRAGRDGQPAKSVLYYGSEDESLMQFILRKEVAKMQQKQGPKAANTEHAYEAFQEVVKYCQEAGCRRKRLLAYFGENVDVSLCEGKGCDACADPQKLDLMLAQLARKMSERAAGTSNYRGNMASSTAVEDGYEYPKSYRDSEFWNRDDEDGAPKEGEDDVSESSEDEEAVAAAQRVSKSLGKQATFKESLNKYERAEEAYDRQSLKSKSAAASNRNAITDALREQIRQNVLQKLEKSPAAASTSKETLSNAARELERESFAKCGKSSREVYKSHALGLMRWAANATLEQLCARFGALFEASDGAASASGSASKVVTGVEGQRQTAAALSGQKRKIDGSSTKKNVVGRSSVDASKQRGIGTGPEQFSQPPPILSFDEFREQEKVQRKKATCKNSDAIDP